MDLAVCSGGACGWPLGQGNSEGMEGMDVGEVVWAGMGGRGWGLEMGVRGWVRDEE